MHQDSLYSGSGPIFAGLAISEPKGLDFGLNFGHRIAPPRRNLVPTTNEKDVSSAGGEFDLVGEEGEE